jgi:hypothetical protein
MQFIATTKKNSPQKKRRRIEEKRPQPASQAKKNKVEER